MIARIRLILNSAFMIGAVVTVILYFAMPNDPMPMFMVCSTAIMLKFAEYFLRIFQNNTTKRNK